MKRILITALVAIFTFAGEVYACDDFHTKISNCSPTLVNLSIQWGQ